MNTKPLLRDPDIPLGEKVLKEALGAEVYVVFEAFMNRCETEFGLNQEWRFYKDGGAWLCKVQFKKKTVFWLSVWPEMFKVTFYFTEKTRAGIKDLDIDKQFKDKILQMEPGKFMPMTFDISGEEFMDDLYQMILYKKTLK